MSGSEISAGRRWERWREVVLLPSWREKPIPRICRPIPGMTATISQWRQRSHSPH